MSLSLRAPLSCETEMQGSSTGTCEVRSEKNTPDLHRSDRFAIHEFETHNFSQPASIFQSRTNRLRRDYKDQQSQPPWNLRAACVLVNRLRLLYRFIAVTLIPYHFAMERLAKNLHPTNRWYIIDVRVSYWIFHRNFLFICLRRDGHWPSTVIKINSSFNLDTTY